MENDNQHNHRKIRSFVKRVGRRTASQERALENLMPVYGVDNTQDFLDFDSLFGRSAETILEIGFGMGQSLLEQAKINPQINYLGIEVHSPGIGSLLNGMEEAGVTNIRVCNADAVEVLEKIADQSLAGVQLFFPDPWHKNKHHKRRIVNATFVETILNCLQPEGFFHLATDWENYAEQMLQILSAAQCFENNSEQGNYISRPDTRPLTKFEKRGQRLGHGVWDLMFIRKPS